MPNSLWKVVERRVAAFFGATRRALSGSNSKSGGSDDAMHPRLFIEAKSKISMPIWRLWLSTKKLAEKEGNKTVVLGLHQKGRSDFLLVINRDDLLAVAAERLKAIAYDATSNHDITINAHAAIASIESLKAAGHDMGVSL